MLKWLLYSHSLKGRVREVMRGSNRRSVWSTCATESTWPSRSPTIWRPCARSCSSSWAPTVGPTGNELNLWSMSYAAGKAELRNG